MRSFGDFRVLTPELVDGIAVYLRERYGILETTWEDYIWLRRDDATAIWVLGKKARSARLIGLETSGILAFRQPPPEGYPTNGFMRVFGAHAQRNIFEILDESTLLCFLHGESIQNGSPPEEQGYCPVLYNGLAVGRGEWKNGVLKCMLPKALRLQDTTRKT